MIASATPVSKRVRKNTRAVRAFRASTPVSPATGAPLLSQLCAEIDIVSAKGPMDRAITGLCTDSRKARRGVLFFALPGDSTDGSLYIQEAIDRGAVAVMTERVQYWHPDVTFMQVSDVREVLADIASRFHGHPAANLDIVGVAGSKGKTCVAHLLHHLLESEQPAGLISTNAYLLGRRSAPPSGTTPEADVLHEMLAEMNRGGCTRAVVEASSMGVARKNLESLPLKVGIFLNLGRDDARRHGGMEQGFAVCQRLFCDDTSACPETAVVNLDDPWGRRLIQTLPEPVKLVTFGENSHATVRATEVESGADGLVMRLEWPGGSVKMRSPLFGRFQVTNLLAAAAAAYALGLDLNTVLPAAASYRGTAGRMELIDEGQPFTVLVDYAHTPDSVEAMLQAASELSFGRVLTVAGCGGGGNCGLRAFFVETLQEHSDFVWATSDNPRKESMERIFADMRRGVIDPQSIIFMESRRDAIASALEAAGPGDVVVISGKGHEVFQEIDGRLHPFDDRQTARELIAKLPLSLS